MSGNHYTLRGRTYVAGKVISDFGQSSIDCVVRRATDDGAVIEFENIFGVPECFHLLIPGEGPPQECKRAWQSDKQIGVTFVKARLTIATDTQPAGQERRATDSTTRLMMLSLRAALDEMEIGVVLLDANLKSRFINKCFRRMWALPDEIADRNVAFVALMYHGRDTRAYATADVDLDAYVAERVRLVMDGDTTPMDLRRSSGEIIRVQCAVLPDGGRMLSYTYVTDIIRHSDELEVLKSALDNVQDGIVLLDKDLNAQFLNRKIRKFWDVSEERAASHPSYASLITSTRHALGPKTTDKEKSAFFEKRIAEVRAGDHTPRDLVTPDGRYLRAHCTVLDDGGRMITYWDISELVLKEQQLEKLASTDSLTGLYNRRHFLEIAEAEWERFQRYHRPLSVLMIDIDHFKKVNDQYGHAIGDEALIGVGRALNNRRRKSDIVGRIGGEEFAILLPETDILQARTVANRLCKRISEKVVRSQSVQFKVTASIGIASASASMSGIDALMKSADTALYQAKALGRNRAEQWSPLDAPKMVADERHEESVN